MNEYQKILSRPEARHRYWHIHKIDRDFFPQTHRPFSVEFNGKKYSLKVNHKDDVMTGQLYETYQFLEGHRVIIKKKFQNEFTLYAPDTKPYPTRSP